jgi:cephalosporin hydroxylase
MGETFRWPAHRGRSQGRSIVDLYQYFVTQTERNIVKCVHYFAIYERHFARFRDNPITMFEIGTGEGGSCRMWKQYFGPMCRIVTLDIADKKQFEEKQIFVRTGDQSDPKFLKSLLDEFGAPDIVLDDGSHLMPHINASFDVLFPAMRAGTYLVEDLDGAYRPDKGGGLHSPESFVERAKSLVDEMNAVHTRGQLKPSIYGKGLFGIALYQSVVVLEKTPFLNTQMIRRPTPLPARAP